MTSYIFILFYKFLTLFNGLGSFLCKIYADEILLQSRLK